MLKPYEYRPGPSRGKYADLAEHLRNNPGIWVKVRTASTEPGAWSAAQQIKTGRRADFRPAGHYDAYTHGRDVIASYIGGGACHGGTLPNGGYCTICGTVDAGGVA